MDPRETGTACSRREFVAGGLCGAVTLALGGGAIAGEGPELAAPILRRIPSTGEQLPVIGLGTNTFGASDPVGYEARREVLQQLPELGGKVVDTARGYGDSEVVIGRALKELGNRDRLFLASRTPMSGDVSGGRSVVEESFRRLQVGVIDLIQVHNLHGLDKSAATPAPCAGIADTNCDGAVQSADIIRMVNYVFKSGAAPCDACSVFPNNTCS